MDPKAATPSGVNAAIAVVHFIQVFAVGVSALASRRIGALSDAEIEGDTRTRVCIVVCLSRAGLRQSRHAFQYNGSSHVAHNRFINRGHAVM